MANQRKRCVIIPVLLFLCLAAAGAQTGASGGGSSRLAGDWRSSAPVVLPGSRGPLSATGSDQGAAPATLGLDRMLLLLAPSVAQQRALAAELTSLQDPNSPEYHRWLTPADFAGRYANSPADVGAVVAWLQSQEFQVAPLPLGLGWVEFSGTVAQAEQAFHSSIHMVAGADGVARPVFVSDISIPGALRPVVAGLVSLDGVLASPALAAPQPLIVSAADLAAETTPNGAEALTPRMEAQLLNLAPLTRAGITGAGQTVAIAARSDINPADVTAFQTAFGLPAAPVAVKPSGADPGLTAGQADATFAASWVGAMAPGAKVILVPAATTQATDGADLSLAAIVDQDLGSTAVVDYSACEAGMSAAHQAYYSALYQQAAAEGIAVIAAAGDSGAAACALPGSGAPVTSGYGVNALASTLWNTAVGVAAFGTSGPAGLAAWSPRSPADPAYAGGGGGSRLYRDPAWQPIPAQLTAHAAPARLLPDLSLPTAIDTGSNAGLAFCLSGSGASSGCTLMRSGGSGAAASLFAGIAARMAQQHGAEGNIAPSLYKFSTQTGIFSDVAQGAAQLSCAAGSPGCDVNGKIGYSASSGYDLATGLGVPDANALVMAQPQGNGAAPATVANTIAGGQIINPSGSVVLSATVTSGTGGAAPTGTVLFYDQTLSSDIITVSLTPGGTSSTASQTATGLLAQGAHEIVAEYSGDATYAAANSAAVLVEAEPSTTTTAVTPANGTPSAGSALTLTALVTSANAGAGALAPSGTVAFSLDGVAQGSAPLRAGLASGAETNSSASINITTPYTSGAHKITGVYSGDANYDTSTSTAATINVTASTPTVVLTPSSTTPGTGGNFTLTATITPPGAGAGAPAPTGTVTFTMNGANVGTATVGLSGTAILTITTPAIGTYTAIANYSGDSNYNPAASAPVTINVGKTGTSLTVSPATTTPAANAPLKVTATLTELSSSVNAPTGTVTFTLDGATVGTAAIAGDPVATASITITAPATGTHTLGASYSGDNTFAASIAPGVAITIPKTTTTITANPTTTTPALGSSLTVNSTITPSTYGAADPTGTVSYTMDGVVMGAPVPVVPGAPSTSSTTFTVNTAGTHTLGALYSGDGTYASSASTPVTLTIAKLTMNPATTTPSAGSSLLVTATINTSGASTIAPSGTVTFTLDGAFAGTGNVIATSPATATATFTVPSAGSHTLQATYNGDANYAVSTATAITLNVAKSTPTVVLAPATTSPAAGSNLQLTVQISPPAAGAAAPGGTVNFLVDGTAVGTALVVAGNPATATLTIAAPAIGAHSLTAIYSGDGNYNTATSPAVTINVTKGTTTLTVAPASTAPTANSTMLVTATINATATGSTVPTGTVSFTMDGAPVGSGAVSGGTTASTTVTVPATGTHTLQASYSGDANFNGSISPTAVFTVAKTATTTILVPSTTTPALGATLPVSATVTPATPGSNPVTGSISFTVDGVTSGIQPLTPGTPATASMTLPALPPGPHTLAAVYTGDTYYAASTATGVSVTVPKSPTAMTVTPATTTPPGGSSLAVSAVIVATNPGSTLPTGTVNFTLDGATVATSAVVPGSPATATATIPAIPAGTHVLAANYSGDAYYASTIAGSVTITVSKSPTTITVTPSTLTPTAGGSMTVTAAIASSSPATTGPSGTVSISVDGVTVATGTVTPGTPSTANVTVPLVSAGTHVIAGTYSGDNYYTGSSSSTVSFTAAKGTTVTKVTATPATLTAGTAETLTATVTPTTAVTGVTYTITGVVSFYDGTKLLGQVAVTSGTATLAGLDLPDNVSHSITAVYSGDANWLGSTSLALPLAATTLPDVVMLKANYSVAQPGVAIVLTATVTPTTAPTAATAEQNPTGTVIFYDGTKVIGTAPLVASSTDDSSTATLTTQTLPGGQVSLTAYYQGDLTYDAALSNILTLTVQGFVLAPASTNPPTNLNIVQGSAGSASFTITGQGGFNNLVQVECQVPTQDNMTCTANPQQVTPPGTVTFVVQTFTAQHALMHEPPFWPRAAGGTALAALVFFLLPFGRRARTFLHLNSRMLILLLLLAGLCGAGNGCSSSSTLNTFGTPLGVATLKVTAQAYVDNTAVSQSVYFTVNVLAPGSTP
jgi:subtilase family serine protease